MPWHCALPRAPINIKCLLTRLLMSLERAVQIVIFWHFKKLGRAKNLKRNPVFSFEGQVLLWLKQLQSNYYNKGLKLPIKIQVISAQLKPSDIAVFSAQNMPSFKKALQDSLRKLVVCYERSRKNGMVKDRKLSTWVFNLRCNCVYPKNQFVVA